MNEQLREIDIRLAIFKLKIKPLGKLVLLAILQRVDWSTFSGDVSSNDIATTLNHNRRSIVRHIVELKAAGYIKRISTRVESDLNAKSTTSLNVSYILKCSEETKQKAKRERVSKGSVKMTHSDNVSHGDKLTHSDNVSQGVVTKKVLGSDRMTQGGSDRMTHNYNLINNSLNYETIEQCDKLTHSDKMTLPPPDMKPDLRLEEYQIKAIEKQLKRLNIADSFENRKRVARKLFRIDLLKGGYYETL